MTEGAFQEKVLDYCKWLRLKVYHVKRSDKGVVTSQGFPDLVIVGPKGTVFAELKSTTGKVSLAQEEWIAALTQSGQRAYVWRPEDWEQVQNVLKELGG